MVILHFVRQPTKFPLTSLSASRLLPANTTGFAIQAAPLPRSALSFGNGGSSCFETTSFSHFSVILNASLCSYVQGRSSGRAAASRREGRRRRSRREFLGSLFTGTPFRQVTLCDGGHFTLRYVLRVVNCSGALVLMHVLAHYGCSQTFDSFCPEEELTGSVSAGSSGKTAHSSQAPSRVLKLFQVHSFQKFISPAQFKYF